MVILNETTSTNSATRDPPQKIFDELSTDEWNVLGKEVMTTSQL